MKHGGVRSRRGSVKILITGSTGLLGQALVASLSPAHEVVGLSRHALSAGAASPRHRHLVVDLQDGDATRRLVQELDPDLIVHTQALSDVDRCEREPEDARAQNVATTERLVKALQGRQARLIHMSTDYVFDGAKGMPYDENDLPHPLSVYGMTKLDAERAALRHQRAIIVRTSTLYGQARSNFCDSIIATMRGGQSVGAFTDQVTSPSWVEDLAQGLGELGLALWHRQDGTWPRVVHLTNAGACSRVAFADRVATLLGMSPALVRRISIAEQKLPAPRPAYSALASIHLPQLIGRRLRPWDQALQAYLQQHHQLVG